jgi:hypothetical protein
MGEMRNVCKILVRKSEGKRPLKRCKRRWEDNIIMNLKERACVGVEWIHVNSGHGPVAGSC